MQRATDAVRRAEERAKAQGAQRLKQAQAQQKQAETAADAARAESVELRFRLRLAELRASAAQVGLASPNPPRHLPQHSPLSARGGYASSPASEVASGSPCGSSPGVQSSDGECLTPSPNKGAAGARAKKTSSGGARERAVYYVVEADGGWGGSGGGSRAGGQRRAVPMVPFRGLSDAEAAAGEGCGPPAAAASRKQQLPPMSPGTRALLTAEG